MDNFGMPDVPSDIIKCVLDWAFDPLSSEWVDTVFIESDCDPKLIDFFWSMYVVVKCKGVNCVDCPCVSRCKGLFETVLRQSRSMETLKPWCSRLETISAFHRADASNNNQDDDSNTSPLGCLIQLGKCGSMNPQTLQRLFKSLVCCGSAAGICFLVRVASFVIQPFDEGGNLGLVEAAQNGHASVLKYFLSELGSVERYMNKNAAVRAASRNGHVKVLEVLHENLGLSADDAFSALLAAAKRGDVNVLQFLQHACTFPPYNCYCYMTAAGSGHVNVLEFLDRIWSVTTVEGKLSDIRSAMHAAAVDGHVNVLEYLYRTFHLGAEDARAWENLALRSAAKNGHVDVLKFLHSTWGLTADDARCKDNYALGVAAENGHTNVLEFLHKTWKLTDADARSCSNYAFLQAARNRRVLTFLENTWKIC